MMHHILLFQLLIVAYFSGSQAENAFSKYWEEHISLPQPPHWFSSKASPLSPHQVAVFTKLIQENELASHLRSFCEQANIACSTNELVKTTMENTTLPPIARWNAEKEKYDAVAAIPLSVAKQGGLPYFRASMVKEGSVMAIPDLRDQMSYKSFLPRSLASKIPFSFTRMEELKNIFGVVDEKMSEFIQEALEVCEKSTIPGEPRICATSAEDLIDFIVENLGQSLSIWSTESIEGSYENATIGTVKIIYENLSQPPALCHSQPFIYQVYFCHILPKVKVFAVDIHAQKKVNHAIMACHYDTSTWDPNHIAFKLNGFGPGLIEVCHWVNENGMIWTKAI
ncbi:polygalacturonase non-catalytic subunit AroGP2-like [Telopea speciosissima]|uniref:polygalacturonase non-catalytic subunit AroGP2-like n=1 Tax=Telopea speciosissima TaxID=54955 RepID=UPI001CC75BC3|nr:polygalacturonase non-catalytic subunit AroGP2-like [Telopea speciosissima]